MTRLFWCALLVVAALAFNGFLLYDEEIVKLLCCATEERRGEAGDEEGEEIAESGGCTHPQLGLCTAFSC